MVDIGRRSLLGFTAAAFAGCAGTQGPSPPSTDGAQIFTTSPTGGRVAVFPATDGAYGRPLTVVVSDENNNTLRVYTLDGNRLRIQGYDLTGQFLLDITVPAQCTAGTINPSLPRGVIGNVVDLARGGGQLPVEAPNPEALQLIAQAKPEIEAALAALAARSLQIPNGQSGAGCGGQLMHHFLRSGQQPVVQVNAGVGNNVMALYQADHMWLRADYSERDVKIYAAILSAQPNGRPVINVFPYGTDNLNFSTLRQSMLRAIRSPSMQSFVPLSIPQQQIIADAYTAAIITAMNGIGETARRYQSSRATDGVRRLFRGDQFSQAGLPAELAADPFVYMRNDAVLRQYLPNPQMLVTPRLAPATPLPLPPRQAVPPTATPSPVLPRPASPPPAVAPAPRPFPTAPSNQPRWTWVRNLLNVG